MAQETVAETRAREEMYKAVETALESGMTWYQVTKHLREAWVQVHRSRLAMAEKDAYLQPKQ